MACSLVPYHNPFRSPNSIQQSACLQSSLIFILFFSLHMLPVMLLASGVWRSGCPSPVSGVFLETSRGGATKDSVLSPWKRFKQFHRVCSRRSSVTRKREETDLEWILRAKNPSHLKEQTSILLPSFFPLTPPFFFFFFFFVGWEKITIVYSRFQCLVSIISPKVVLFPGWTSAYEASYDYAGLWSIL